MSRRHNEATLALLLEVLGRIWSPSRAILGLVGGSSEGLGDVLEASWEILWASWRSFFAMSFF